MSEAKLLYDQGLRAERAGKPEEALRLYGEAVRIDPTLRVAHNNRGALFARLGRSAEALKSFQIALDLGEDEAVHFNLGSEFFRTGDLEQSKKHLIRALKRNPRLLRAHVLLAYLYAKLKEREKSWIYFRNALQIEPGNRVALLGYAVSLSEAEKYEEALSALEKSGGDLSDNESLRNLKAGLLLKLNRYNDSLKEYADLTKNSSKFRSFTDHLQEAKEQHEGDYRKIFDSIDDRIEEKTRQLKEKFGKKKKDQISAGASGAGGPTAPLLPDKEDLKEMVDLSLLHLFRGDTEKALRFLFQAKKMKENA